MIQQKHLCTVELKGYNWNNAFIVIAPVENKNIESQFDGECNTCTIGKRDCACTLRLKLTPWQTGIANNHHMMVMLSQPDNHDLKTSTRAVTEAKYSNTEQTRSEQPIIALKVVFVLLISLLCIYCPSTHLITLEKDQKDNENKNIEWKFDGKRSVTTCTIGKRVCCRSGRSNFLFDAHHWRKRHGPAATYSRLANAFRQCGRQDLVERVSVLVERRETCLSTGELALLGA